MNGYLSKVFLRDRTKPRPDPLEPPVQCPTQPSHNTSGSLNPSTAPSGFGGWPSVILPVFVLYIERYAPNWAVSYARLRIRPRNANQLKRPPKRSASPAASGTKPGPPVGGRTPAPYWTCAAPYWAAPAYWSEAVPCAIAGRPQAA